jgi:hypothetical protein
VSYFSNLIIHIFTECLKGTEEINNDNLMKEKSYCLDRALYNILMAALVSEVS